MSKIVFTRSGIIPVYKESGPTSTDIIRNLKKKYSFKKIGHLGTLDPMAEGVLPIMINQATKLAPLLEDEVKKYKTVVKFGIKTDTDDITGNVIHFAEAFNLNKNDLREVLTGFLGEQEQIPPLYSAKKINGKRAYKLAREGKEFEIKPQKIEIYEIELKRFALPYAEIEIKCSKGTYIRSVVRDLGDKLGIPSTMSKLIRLSSSGFDFKNSVKLREISENIGDYIIPLENIFNFPKVHINKFEQKLIQNGQIPKMIKISSDGYTQLFFKNKLSAILYMDKNEVGIFRVFKQD